MRSGRVRCETHDVGVGKTRLEQSAVARVLARLAWPREGGWATAGNRRRRTVSYGKSQLKCFASPVATAVDVTWCAAIDRRTISYRSFRILTNAKTRGLHLQSERLTHLSTHLFFWQ